MTKSLFEKEEKENAIAIFKVDLISRFYSFENKEIIRYKKALNFENLVSNEFIQWDNELLEEVADKIDWRIAYRLKNIKQDLLFFQKFEKLIDFKSMYLSRNIDWSDELLELYGDKFDWSTSLITNPQLSTILNLRKYRDIIDWKMTSKWIRFNSLTTNDIDEFVDKWDWKLLSRNPHLPVSVEFIRKYSDKLDFDELSRNPSALHLINKYPTSEKWNWDKVIGNRGIVYNQESFDFMFSHFIKYYENKIHNLTAMKAYALPIFLKKVFYYNLNDLSFFFKKPYIELLPWDIFSKYCKTKLSEDFIETYKVKLDFKETELLRCARDVITTDFIKENHELFNNKSYAFYYLPITIELIKNYFPVIEWRWLSGCETVDWNWNFIEEHFDDLNLYKLSGNKAVYTEIVEKNMTKEQVIKLLDYKIENKL